MLVSHCDNNSVTRPSGIRKIELVSQLIQRLEAEGVRYCHWKSNFYIEQSLAGEGDLDLLVHREDAARFKSVLALLGFKSAIDPLRPHTPSVSHFYGLDLATGALIHLHVYYRLITGESLLKNYSLPLEALLLENPRVVEGMPVARAEAELIIFVVRTMLKYSSVAEHLLVAGSDQDIRAELQALLAGGATGRAEELLEQWLPAVDPHLFSECVQSLQKGAWWGRRFWLARRLRRQLRSLSRFSGLSEMGSRLKVFCTMGTRWLLGRGSQKDLAAGGAVFAFIGLDASGKSTLVRETKSWLGKVFRVSSGHLGKPPSAWLTLLPNFAGWLVRLALPRLRMSARQNDRAEADNGQAGLLYQLRMVLLAWDRRALAIRLRRKAANGWVVLCDRYPSAVVGTIDGATLKLPDDKTATRGLRGYLAKLENRLYRQIPPPDLVIRVAAPVDVAIARNRHRQEPGKDKSDAYLMYNHKSVKLPFFPNVPTIEVDTNQPRAETVQTVRRIVWDVL